MNNTFYKGYYEDHYLAHHGVLGMKWGVRRYQNPDGSLTSLGRRRYGKADIQDAKAEASRFSKKKQYHARNAEAMRGELQRGINVKNAKGLANKYSQAFGFGNLKNEYEHRSKGYKKAAEYSKSNHDYRKNKIAEYNTKQLAKYAESMLNNTSAGKRAFQSLVVRTGMLKVPVKTIAGRDTTIGKEMVLGMLTGGIGNLALDTAHRVSKGKEIRKDYMDEFNKITNKRDEKIKKIEDSYKRGQNLSKKDAELESKIEDQYSKEYDELREKYKKRKREDF